MSEISERAVDEFAEAARRFCSWATSPVASQEQEAAAALEERAEKQSSRLTGQAGPDPSPRAGPVVREVELWDLVSAFARLMRETQAYETATIAVDDTPQHVYESQLAERVVREAASPSATPSRRPTSRPGSSVSSWPSSN